MYKNLIQLKKKKKSHRLILKKQAKDLSRHFPQEHIEMANRYMNRRLTSLIVRKMQIRTAEKYSSHSPAVKAGRVPRPAGMWERGALHGLSVGSCGGSATTEKHYGGFSKS